MPPFFFETVQQRIEALSLPGAIEQAVLTELILARYLERVAARRIQAEARRRCQALSIRLLTPLQQPTHPIQALDAQTRRLIEQAAEDGVDRLQRRSSWVEGRNGRWSLHHHGRHRLSERRLAALTARHKFHLRRPDGTAVAERFFGHAYEPLFEPVLHRMPWPPRPARRRPPKPPHLAPVAA